ncbi:KIDINS220 family protein [Megaselia abdita]
MRISKSLDGLVLSASRLSLSNLLRTPGKSKDALNRYGDSMGSLGHRALLQYLDSNDLQGLKSILDSRHLTVDDRDENGTTILMVAASRGLIPFVRELISRGADIQAEDNDNWTALLNAAKSGHFDILQLLIEHGADYEHRDMGGWTPLLWAAYRGHTEIVQFLLEKNCDVNAHGNFHLGPLLWSAGRGHKEIVELLIKRGAKVNVGDKYGTTALVWACRRGHSEIVEVLLKAGANVDTAGMYSWTPLLVSVCGGHMECVSALLEKRPNVNALDKDGLTALSIACREGFHEIANALIASNAYINIQDRANDTPLIHAVKGGHRSVVESLLKKHADVDIQGKERKTALYTAVEKGHINIVRLLLHSNPDLELPTKDGDTPLLRAVRNRNLEIVQMLLDRRAKVTACDKRGDTCLHIGMRARSKAIVEALLRNPKNSQLLYRANKAGETPYAIDTNHQKTILGKIFGARRLNTNEDSEGMLGYELYSSALADVLSEPTLTMPITVGLYAKWGSGKSFLLTKLKEEMNNFAKQWAEPPIRAKGLFFLVFFHVALILGTIVGLCTWSALWGFVTAVSILMFVYALLLSIHYASDRMNAYWAYSVYNGIMKRMGRFRLILQVAFCHPPGLQTESEVQTKPIRFQFAEASAASPTGEGAVAHMIVNLFEAIETQYGWLSTRLYRAFRPRALKLTPNWKWRRMCCLPIFVIFEITFLTLITGIALVITFFAKGEKNLSSTDVHNIKVTLYVICALLATVIFTNLHVILKALKSLFFSQSRHLRRALRSNESAPLTTLGAEVALMTDMVKCLDAFTNQQSRLVGVVDALDSCDTERILSVLNSIQTLLSSPNRPFVLLIAVDPHVIAKAAEANSRKLFTEGGIGGHDFLRNLVHLPVYLQNSGLRKVQRAQLTAVAWKRTYTDYNDDFGGGTLGHSASARRLSSASEIMSSQEKLRTNSTSNPPPRAGSSKKLRLSESVASSIGSNLHRIGQPHQGVLDMSKIMLTDDYFSDVNPRSMRRLMNVIYITVRLLKAFQIDFSWYRLSSWINLTEQWPLRASMIVLQHDQSGESMDDSVSLQSVYEKVRPRLSCLREASSLLELDRDERKLDAFLQLHKSDLLVADLRIFLPFTINLDPYLRKVLKEDQQAAEDEGIVFQPKVPQLPMINRPQQLPYTQQYNNTVSQYQPYHYNDSTYNQQQHFMEPRQILGKSVSEVSLPLDSFPEDILHTNLSDLSVEGVVVMLGRIDDLKPALTKLTNVLQENAISGRVLKHCDLNELKSVMGLSFGHWELFRLLITTLKDYEKSHKKVKLPAIGLTESTPGTENTDSNLFVPNPPLRKNSSAMHMEKQVTLEEQMICGALQTLNEEAYEDVASSDRPTGAAITPPPSNQPTSGELHLEPIRESSEFGSPCDDSRYNNIINNSNNIINNLNKHQSLQMQQLQLEYINNCSNHNNHLNHLHHHNHHPHHPHHQNHLQLQKQNNNNNNNNNIMRNLFTSDDDGSQSRHETITIDDDDLKLPSVEDNSEVEANLPSNTTIILMPPPSSSDVDVVDDTRL